MASAAAEARPPPSRCCAPSRAIDSRALSSRFTPAHASLSVVRAGGCGRTPMALSALFTCSSAWSEVGARSLRRSMLRRSSLISCRSSRFSSLATLTLWSKDWTSTPGCACTASGSTDDAAGAAAGAALPSSRAILADAERGDADGLCTDGLSRAGGCGVKRLSATGCALTCGTLGERAGLMAVAGNIDPGYHGSDEVYLPVRAIAEAGRRRMALAGEAGKLPISPVAIISRRCARLLICGSPTRRRLTSPSMSSCRLRCGGEKGG